MGGTLPEELTRTPMKPVTLAVGTSVGASDAIDVRKASALKFRRLSGAFTSVTVHESDTIDGTFTAVEDSAGNAISLTGLTGNTRVINPDIFACSFIKFVAASAGSALIGGKC